MVMSLPVSQYEALLAEVRGLRQKAQRVQQLARPLLQGDSSPGAFCGTYRPCSPPDASYLLLQNDSTCEPLDYTMESLLLGRQLNTAGSPNYENGVASSVEGDTTCSEDEYGGARSSTKMSVSSEPVTHRNRGMLSLYHGTWPVEKTMWNSEPARLGTGSNQPVRNNMSNQMEVTSVMSFASSSGGVPLDRVLGSPETTGKWSSQQLEAKMDVVHSLLAMLGGQEHVDMGETLLALSTCPESCLAMRQSGCIPLLVQLVQSDRDGDTRRKASQALHNLVNSQPDEKLRKRESRILKLLEQCRGYTEALKNDTEYEQPESSSSSEVDDDKHPVQTVAHLMKLSFDEGHRQAICQLGGIHTIASLVEAEHTLHGSISDESHCILMRRYACMALTNLTFGDSGNKALLCSFREFMRALVVQLQSPSDELRQVTASVLRNLSWRADSTSKEILREVGSVSGLMKSAMVDNKENTLKSILSALWNLSAHCTENKSEICAVEGALGFLVDMLTYKTPSKSMAIIENSGGILRNISSQIAVREDYREILRCHNCLQILLDQLKSPSLTIVSNACGTLWNLSAKCGADQEVLWQMGAPAMLRSLNHSKHKMIAMGSSAALKNLLTSRPQQTLLPQMDSTALSLDLPALPTLGARKQKALMQDLDQNLSETYENIEKDSPVKKVDNDGTIVDFMQDSHRKHKTRSASPDYLKYESTSRSNPNLEEEHMSNTFASLNLNEPSTSYLSDARPKSRIPQSFGSSSLPYMNPPVKRTNPCTYIPVRNKFSDCAYEDEIVSDQPIDYSQKYSETKLPNNDANNVSSNKDRDNFSYNKSKTEKENFSIYAETDLDQPTDYSLRYAEDDSDSDICNKITKNEPQEYVQDTVKTYCTEDTPYETPFNFSTATSMSDLRMDEKPVIDNDKLKESSPKTNKEVSKSVDEKDHCSTEDISEIDNRPKLADKIPKSEFSSGLMSPEKPVNYCEEGTPGYFSRVSSFGSLNSIPANEAAKNESKGNDTLPLEVGNELEEKQVEKTPPKTPSETKAVKFEQVVNYAEETPLMFSRSSSLASLDSIEQHSIHDDRSSVVSDLSRLTSGIVSPSELPDSPTQTVPPSPKPRKTPLEFPTASKPRTSAENRPQPAPRILMKPSVFEDNITKFKEESTPIQFSTATSLSSLTIDDHEESQVPDLKHSKRSSVGSLMQKEDEAEKKDSEKETNTSDGNDEFIPESEDEGDEDILAACINIGMQKNRHNHISPQTVPTTSKLPLLSFKYTPKIQSNRSILPPRTIPQPNFARPAGIDTLRMYCTEDTPALLSRAGSNSDLSILSIPNDNRASSRGDYLSDDGSILSGDSENILAECIQAGIRAKRESPISNIKPISCLPRRSEQSSTPVKYNPSGNSRRGSGESSRAPSVDMIRRDNYMCARDELDGYSVENQQRSFSPRSNVLAADSSRRDYLSDEGSNLSGDSDNILAECIQAGMQKTTREPPKSNLKPTSSLPRRSLQSSTLNKYSSGDSRIGSGEVSRAPSTDLNRRDNSLLPYPNASGELGSYAIDNAPNNFALRPNRAAGGSSRGEYLSDDSSNLSGDNDILAECIQAGMSKVNRESPKPNLKPTSCLPRRSEQTNTPVKYNPSGNSRREASKASSNDVCRRDNSLPPYLIARDELESYAVENSPCHFSLRSSLSDLTVDGSVAGLKRSPQSNNQLLGSPNTSGSTTQQSVNLNISEETDSEADQAILKECILKGMPKDNSILPVDPQNLPNTRSTLSNNQQQSNLHSTRSSGSIAANLNISEETDSEAEQAMLRECIRAGMPKEIPNSSSKPIDIPNTRSAQLNNQLQCGPRNTQPSGLAAQQSANLSLSLETDLSEEAERAMLQECILAGMPKTHPVSLTKPLDSPNNRSAQPSNQLQHSSHNTQPSGSQQAANLNISEETDSEAEQAMLRECILAGMPKENPISSTKPLNIPNTRLAQPNIQLQRGSRNSPLPRSASHQSANQSLSLETDLSEEAERAILQECILAGMPKTNPASATRPLDVPNTRSNVKRTMGKSSSRHQPEEAKPKNVSAASVAGSTAIQASGVRPDMTPAAAGVEENPEPETGTKIRSHELIQPERTETQTDTSQDKCLHSEENFLTDQEKNGSSKSLGSILDTNHFDDIAEFSFSNSDNIVIEDCLARSCEDSKAVDNRMLDPDAMIESLDRFTAELVSQASHLNKDDDKYKMSTGDNTWNDDTSPNELTFPSISGSAPNVITFSNEEDSNKLDADVVDGVNAGNEPDIPSNDFSSVNTSTMTESTLIAIEASKMATVFKNEAEMSLSITSAVSLELDHVQPPSHLNSLTNSVVGLEKMIPKSPKLIARKKSLPAGLMVRRALNNSLNHGSSLESLENHSLSNLDQVNPPSDLLRDVFDLEGSMTSVASLPSENDIKADFVINGILNKDPQNIQHPIFNLKQPFNGSHYSCNELENINPPSLFNEITDFCNSLADVATEAICSETDIFEDCYTHMADTTLLDENITLAEDDITEFSDAHSATPLQSDLSSADSTPKRLKSLSKSMTTKQRRNLARDRYKTYTVAAEMVMREEGEKQRESSEATEDFKTVQEHSERNTDDTTYVSPTYTVSSPKLTPRERRQMNRSRFETQVLDEAITSILQQPVIETPPPDSPHQSCDSNSCSSSPAQSPARTKLSIRRSFMQKRLENKDRFRTQTLSESSFSPEVSSASPPLINGEAELHLHLQKEADLVLRTLRDTKTTQDELLDCETLSLVSNDDDSEHNSGGSVNYRTYHKSWGFRKNVPVINSENNNQNGLVNCQPNLANDPENQPEVLVTNSATYDISNSDNSEEENQQKTIGRPKIVKPGERHTEPVEDTINEEETKGIRGRRKPLYSKSNLNNKIAPRSIKPIKTMTSNLVKNVTSTLKSGTALKSVNKQVKTIIPKPPTVQSRASSGYGSKPLSNSGSPKTSPARVPSTKSSPKHSPTVTKQQTSTSKGTPPMERQGTFTKDDPSPSGIPKPGSKIPTPATKIPSFASKIARSVVPSKLPSGTSSKPPTARNGCVKSASSDRANKNVRVYNRSTSADSREPVRKMQSSPSSQSLKNDARIQNGAVKKSAIPSPAQRSNSNSSLNSNGSNGTKKQVTSKIASLWKKIEDSKKQVPKKDTRIWIQPESEPDPPRLIRSNTFDNKDGVVLRNNTTEDGDPTKRVSRLGSFIIMDESEDGIRLQQAISAAPTTNGV